MAFKRTRLDTPLPAGVVAPRGKGSAPYTPSPSRFTPTAPAPAPRVSTATAPKVAVRSVSNGQKDRASDWAAINATRAKQGKAPIKQNTPALSRFDKAGGTTSNSSGGGRKTTSLKGVLGRIGSTISNAIRGSKTASPTLTSSRTPTSKTQSAGQSKSAGSKSSSKRK